MRLIRKPSLINKLLTAVSVVCLLAGVALLINHFYQHQTGERLPLPGLNLLNIAVSPTVEEKIITKEEVKQHIVPASHPRYFSLPALGIQQARILQVGRDKATNEIGTPAGIFDVGWFNESGLPGANQKTIVLDGHNGGPTLDGIFKRLHRAPIGSDLSLERGDGQIFNYQIVKNYSVNLDGLTDQQMTEALEQIDGKETITVITCTGKWLRDRKTYDQRTILKAVLK